MTSIDKQEAMGAFSYILDDKKYWVTCSFLVVSHEFGEGIFLR